MIDTVESQREEILARMRQMTDVEPMPGEYGAGDIVHRGNAELDVQMMVGKGKSAGTLYIWDTRTGERSRTNANMLPTQLSKRREDGSQVFTFNNPGIAPVRGTLKCMLHPDDPNRKKYDQWGLATCRKANLPSPQDVKTHMQNRHKREWATIEEDRLRIEREEERELRLASIAQNKASLEAFRRGGYESVMDGEPEQQAAQGGRGRPRRVPVPT